MKMPIFGPEDPGETFTRKDLTAAADWQGKRSYQSGMRSAAMGVFFIAFMLTYAAVSSSLDDKQFLWMMAIGSWIYGGWLAWGRHRDTPPEWG